MIDPARRHKLLKLLNNGWEIDSFHDSKLANKAWNLDIDSVIWVLADREKMLYETFVNRNYTDKAQAGLVNGIYFAYEYVKAAIDATGKEQRYRPNFGNCVLEFAKTYANAADIELDVKTVYDWYGFVAGNHFETVIDEAYAMLDLED